MLQDLQNLIDDTVASLADTAGANRAQGVLAGAVRWEVDGQPRCRHSSGWTPSADRQDEEWTTTVWPYSPALAPKV